MALGIRYITPIINCTQTEKCIKYHSQFCVSDGFVPHVLHSALVDMK